MSDKTTGYISSSDYEEIFFEEGNRKASLEQALDIRKFEIELYWKRAAYFWGFTAVIFAGYFLYMTKVQNHSENVQFAIACIGFMFTYSWYLVNKGSKFWQNNWERHVDLLEDTIQGPLYKTILFRSKVFKKEKRFRRITTEYPFSVSTVNQLLSFYLTGVWLMLGAIPFVKQQFPQLGKAIAQVDMYVAFVLVIIFVIHVNIASVSGWAKAKSVRNVDDSQEKLLIYVREKGSP